jgi:hypothetical protein
MLKSLLCFALGLCCKTFFFINDGEFKQIYSWHYMRASQMLLDYQYLGQSLSLDSRRKYERHTEGMVSNLYHIGKG